MTRWKWVLLPGPLGMLGLLEFAFGVYSASLSALTSANEIEVFRVCATLCDADLAGSPCEVFCTSRRQFAIQSNTVAGERDVVVSVGETRLDACPTLCRHGLGNPLCTCDETEATLSDLKVPGPDDVPWKQICDVFCEDKRRIDGCPECRTSNDRSSIIDNKQTGNIDVAVGSAAILNSSMDVDVSVAPTSHGVLTKTDAPGERDGVDAEVVIFESLETGSRKSTAKREPRSDSTEIDWDKFCEIECERGNGGLACKCDIIP